MNQKYKHLVEPARNFCLSLSGETLREVKLDSDNCKKKSGRFLFSVNTYEFYGLRPSSVKFDIFYQKGVWSIDFDNFKGDLDSLKVFAKKNSELLTRQIRFLRGRNNKLTSLLKKKA
jgi:hypothetical protein